MTWKLFLGASAAAVSTVLAAAPAQAGPDNYTGDVQLTVTNFCPRDTGYAAGAHVSINQYTALYSLMGSTYGGDDRTYFTLPDLRGRVAMGRQSAGVPFQGIYHGYELVALQPWHMPAHTHALRYGPSSAIDNGNPVGRSPATYPTGSDAYTTNQSVTGAMRTDAVETVGSSQAFEIFAPTVALNWCITMDGIYPPRN